MAEKPGDMHILSTRWLGPYRRVLFCIYGIIFGAILTSFFIRNEILLGLTQTTLYGYFFYRLVLITRKLQQISFDKDFLYVRQKDQELVIPLENIESVEIQTLGGVYKVNLYHAEQLGKEFFFKPSLRYPLNFKRKDALVNKLRKQIDLAKMKKQILPVNALKS